jgi:hypothetical protein
MKAGERRGEVVDRASQKGLSHTHIETPHEGRHIKTGERQEVVDRASSKALPRIRCYKTCIHYHTGSHIFLGSPVHDFLALACFYVLLFM